MILLKSIFTSIFDVELPVSIFLIEYSKLSLLSSLKLIFLTSSNLVLLLEIMIELFFKYISSSCSKII